MSEPTLTPADFEFTERGELVVHWRPAETRTGQDRREAEECGTSAHETTVT